MMERMDPCLEGDPGKRIILMELSRVEIEQSGPKNKRAWLVLPGLWKCKTTQMYLTIVAMSLHIQS